MPQRSRSLRLAALGCLGSLMLAAPAHSASLTWTAPASCPGEAEVIARIEADRGGPLADGPAVDFAAHVSQEPDGQLTLAVRHGSPQARTLSATRCEELVTALGQIVSLALGPHVPRETPPPEPEPAPPALEREQTPAQAPRYFWSPVNPRTEPDAPSPTPEPRHTALLALGALLDTASLGTTALGVELGAGLSLGSWLELRAVAGYLPPHTVAGSGATDAGGSFALAFGGALACAVWRDGPWRAPFCAGMEGGSMSASGDGVSQPDAQDLPWVAARAEASLSLRLGAALRARTFAGLALPLLRHEFSVADAPLHQIPALSPRAGVGLEHGF